MERVYNTMKHTGGLSIAMGIVSIVAGISVGVTCIISGATLLKRKKEITF